MDRENVPAKPRATTHATSPDRQWNLYVPEEFVDVRRCMDKLAKESKVSVSKLVMACVWACYPTLDKHVRTDRRFKLNGKEVII